MPNASVESASPGAATVAERISHPGDRSGVTVPEWRVSVSL